MGITSRAALAAGLRKWRKWRQLCAVQRWCEQMKYERVGPQGVVAYLQEKILWQSMGLGVFDL